MDDLFPIGINNGENIGVWSWIVNGTRFVQIQHHTLGIEMLMSLDDAFVLSDSLQRVLFDMIPESDEEL